MHVWHSIYVIKLQERENNESLPVAGVSCWSFARRMVWILVAGVLLLSSVSSPLCVFSCLSAPFGSLSLSRFLSCVLSPAVFFSSRFFSSYILSFFPLFSVFFFSLGESPSSLCFLFPLFSPGPLCLL